MIETWEQYEEALDELGEGVIDFAQTIEALREVPRCWPTVNGVPVMFEDLSPELALIAMETMWPYVLELYKQAPWLLEE